MNIYQCECGAQLYEQDLERHTEKELCRLPNGTICDDREIAQAGVYKIGKKRWLRIETE